MNDGARNYRVGSIVYLMIKPELDQNLQLIWLDAKSYHYSNADKLSLKVEVAEWLKTTGMTPNQTYYGEPMCIELAFKDEVDAQLFCMAWKVESLR